MEDATYVILKSKMAETTETSGTTITINVKTPKEKQEIEVNEDATIREVLKNSLKFSVDWKSKKKA